MPIVRPEYLAFLQTARRAVLATIAPNGQPRQVPICFAIVDNGDGAIIYSPLDEKPKHGSDPHELARVRDLIVRPRVSLLADRWDEEWARLAWLRVEATASLVEPGDPEHDPRMVWSRRATGGPVRVVFLFHLIMQTIVLAEAALDREALMCTALSAHLGLVMADDGKAGHSIFPSRAEGLTVLRGGVVARASELRALETARARVEARYLGGHPALFPATVRSWTEQRERTETLAAITVQLAEFEGLASVAADDPDVFETRVGELIADHVEPARVKALDEMGEGRRAVSIAMAWLEPKLG